MEVVIDHQELLLHLYGSIELDVLMNACSEAKHSGGPLRRRRLKALAEAATEPMIEIDCPLEMFLVGEDAALAIRAIRKFIERGPQSATGVPSSVVEGAEALYGVICDAMDRAALS